MSEFFIDSTPVTLSLELGELRALGIALQTCHACEDPECDEPLHLVFGYALDCVKHQIHCALQDAGVPDEFEGALRDRRARHVAWLDQQRAGLAERGLL